MKAVLFVLALIVAVACAALTNQQQQFLFTKYTEQYQKSYQMSEFFQKFETFKSNLDLIIAHNAKQSSFKMAVNQFADLSAEEFAATVTGLKVEEQSFAQSKLVAPRDYSVQLNQIDWVAKGLVNEVKNQASCGSCWAFASTAPLETIWALSHDNKVPDLSEQQLVDCAGAYGNNGCNGGLMSNAYEYYKAKGGACATSQYPYTAKDGSCKACDAIVRIAGYKKIATNDDAHIEALQDGPIGVAIAASSSAFQFYSSGILENCTDKAVNHGVTMTAYYKDSGEYYVLRNSWGLSWGDAGYIKVRARTNQCALTTSSFDAQPTL